MRISVPGLVGLATAALVPFGIALADLGGGQKEANANAGDAVARVLDAQRIVSGIAKVRAELATALASARKAEDLLLSACLARKLEEVDELIGRADTQLAQVRSAEAASAQASYVVMTVLGQRASLVAEEAAHCVGADQQSPALSPAEIASPTDPNADTSTRASSASGDGSSIAEPAATLGTPAARATGTSTSTSPSIGDPLPDMPSVASPLR